MEYPGQTASHGNDGSECWDREASLREAEAFQRSLMENLPMGVFIVDPDTRQVEDVNHQAAAWFGASRDRIVGRRCHAFVCPAAEHACPVCDLGREVDRSERELVRADGSRMPILKSVKRIQVGGREKLLECFLDLTERNRAEVERQRLQDDLHHAEKMESVGSLAAGVAHDMNNVLAAIQISAELLGQEVSRDTKAAKAVESILHAAGRGRGLIQSLSTFALRGRQETCSMDLNDLVRKEADLLRRTTLQRIEVVVDLDPALPAVLADPSALGSAIMNLSLNSLDAMDQGGTLTFRTRARPDGLVLVEVADTGHGMSPEVLAKATDPYFTTKPVGKGTGLGLARVYGTVQALGGAMELHSVPGQGTTVQVRLPALPPGIHTTPPPCPEPEDTSTPCLDILVVDDDPLILESVASLLGASGHRVAVATSGEQAMQALEAGTVVDLVVLDHQMPGLTGYDTLLRLRRAWPDLPVLLTTGYLDPATERLVEAIPRVRVLMKPYSFAHLQAGWRELAGGTPPCARLTPGP